LIRLEEGQFGWDFLIVDVLTGESTLIQTDWDYPSVATLFGWTPCHKETDGTIDCPICGKTAHEMIADAHDYLYYNVGNVVKDPGYFY